MAKKTVRVITRETDGTLRTRDFDSVDHILGTHEQVGVDDCSTDLTLRGFPVFRGLVGPIPESKSIVRYESPEVFESLTKEWSNTAVKRRSRRKAPVATTEVATA